jgi:hypothetical protein
MVRAFASRHPRLALTLASARSSRQGIGYRGGFGMYKLLTGLLGSVLIGVGAASAAAPCARPTDVTAFDVAGLKSKLMVTAITCNQQDLYNQFVRRFQSDLMVHEHNLHAYFVRVYGGRAQHEHDDYITSLANTLSESGIQQGTLFCQQNVSIFNEVLALAKGTDLPVYAASKAFPQPIAVAACPAPTRTAQAGRR